MHWLARALEHPLTARHRPAPPLMPVPMHPLRALRYDGWENAITGLGTLRDKLRAHQPRLTPQLNDSALEALHSDDDICARIVEQLPSDALRAGFSITLKATDGKPPDELVEAARRIDTALTELGASAALREAWIWGRLYGFGAVFMGCDDGLDTEEPLDLEAVTALTHLTVFRRTQLEPYRYYDDPSAARFGQVEIYRVIPVSVASATASASQRRPEWSYRDLLVHESRLLKFRGVLTSRWGAASGWYWDDSVLQRVYQVVQSFASSWQSAAHLLTDASQGVLRLKNLMQLMTGAGEERLRKRMQLIDLCRSVCRAILLDEGETFERVPTPFTGIPELLDRMMSRVAGAASMPQTLLFGRSPAGLNATGESDIRTWYDQVSSERDVRLTPLIEQLTRVLSATDNGPTAGALVDGFCVEYPPLWQPTDKEQAETFKVKSDALATLVNAQIILPEEAALRLAHTADFSELDVEARAAQLNPELRRLASDNDAPDPDEPNAPAP